MKKKRVDYEVLRLIAILGVVFNHTQERGFSLYKMEGCSTVNYALSLILSILCKVAVPLFFMISGGLLLQRQEPVKTVLRRRVGRMAAVLALFSAVLYGFWCSWGYVREPGVWDFVQRLWSSGISEPYWYLYAYLGLMLMLPLLRPMVQGMSDRSFLYLAILHLMCCGVLPIFGLAAVLGRLNSDFSVPLAGQTLFYFIFGYYLAHRLDWGKVGKKQLAALWGLTVAAVAVMFAMVTLDLRRNGQTTMDMHMTLSFFPIMAIYATVHQLCAWHTMSPRLSGLLCTLGGCVFGTYLLEGILRYYLSFIYENLHLTIHVLPACMLWVLAVVVAGLAVTWVLKHIPGLRRLL